LRNDRGKTSGGIDAASGKREIQFPTEIATGTTSQKNKKPSVFGFKKSWKCTGGWGTPAGSVGVRRQTNPGRLLPAGSSRDERLDPFTLPVRFTAPDKTADGNVRHVELSRELAIVRRAIAGIKMAVQLPIATFRGVALRMEPPSDHDGGAVAIVLEHHDPALSLTLFRAGDSTDVIAEWQSWARVLAVPLLVAESDGDLREPFKHVGSLQVGTPSSRRRRRSAIRSRRPTIFLRRKPGRSIVDAAIHRDEREIIARN